MSDVPVNDVREAVLKRLLPRQLNGDLWSLQTPFSLQAGDKCHISCVDGSRGDLITVETNDPFKGMITAIDYGRSLRYEHLQEALQQEPPPPPVQTEPTVVQLTASARKRSQNAKTTKQNKKKTRATVINGEAATQEPTQDAAPVPARTVAASQKKSRTTKVIKKKAAMISRGAPGSSENLQPPTPMTYNVTCIQSLLESGRQSVDEIREQLQAPPAPEPPLPAPPATEPPLPAMLAPEPPLPDLPVPEPPLPDLPVPEPPLPAMPAPEPPLPALPVPEPPLPALPAPEPPLPAPPATEPPLPDLPVPEPPLPALPAPEPPLPDLPVPELPLPALPAPEPPLPDLPVPELPLPALPVPELLLPAPLPAPELPLPVLPAQQPPLPDLPVPEPPLPVHPGILARLQALEEEVQVLRRWKEKEEARRNKGRTPMATSHTEIQGRLEHVFVGGLRTLQVKPQVLDIVLPFAPCHKDVSRRLVNMLFLEEERIGRNVRGRKNPPMDVAKMRAVRKATFELCPTGGEDEATVWNRCITSIDNQNRNLRRIENRL